MKHNFFAYFVYLMYVIALAVAARMILFTQEGSLLVIVGIWFVPPVLFALFPMIFVKRSMLKQLIPTLKNPGALAAHGTIKSIGLDFAFTLLLAFFASMVRMVTGDIPTFELWGLSQTVGIIAIEVCCLIGIFAWLSRMLEYHLVWHKIEAIHHGRVKRVLLYANIVGYTLLTICFAAWQLMIFYQVPEWLWKWL